jgi:prepilin-type N-terminal cleavage/methylation domain-containing protein
MTGLRGGFTLIELMIVVAIVGLLAAMALPQYEAMLLRSKRSEIPSNLDGVRTSELAYAHEWGEYTTVGPDPSAGPPGRKPLQFPATPYSHLDWNLLGWVPDGKTYGQFGVTAFSPSEALIEFTAVGNSDIDGDSIWCEYSTNSQVKPQMFTPNTVY